MLKTIFFYSFYFFFFTLPLAAAAGGAGGGGGKASTASLRRSKVLQTVFTRPSITLAACVLQRYDWLILE